MTKDERKRIIKIYGPDYQEEDAPAYMRKRDEKEKKKAEDLEEDKFYAEKAEKEKRQWHEDTRGLVAELNRVLFHN